MRITSLTAIAVVAAVSFAASIPASQPRAAGATTAIATIVPSDLQTTWDTLLNGLEVGDFTINATIRETSTIRVLLQSKIPSTWVDCGSIAVRSQHKVFGDRSYRFLAANSVRYLVADETSDQLIDVERRTSLNALATIRLKPSARGTLVNVDAHYVMKFKTNEFGKNIEPRDFFAHVDFDSAGHANVDEPIREGAQIKTVTIACRPTGELERRIVGVLNPATS